MKDLFNSPIKRKRMFFLAISLISFGVFLFFLISIFQKENDLVIVPCLSADRQKNRIGYGKGYYDRFLKDFNGVSVSPCYDILLEDEIPTDKYDIKINIVVTDKEVIQWISFQKDFPTIVMKTF